MEIRSHTIVYSKNKAKTQRKRESDLQTRLEELGKLKGFLTAPTLNLSTMH